MTSKTRQKSRKFETEENFEWETGVYLVRTEEESKQIQLKISNFNSSWFWVVTFHPLTFVTKFTGWLYKLIHLFIETNLQPALNMYISAQISKNVNRRDSSAPYFLTKDG